MNNINELQEEVQRYRSIMSWSHEVIYEYVYAEDTAYCYGNFGGISKEEVSRPKIMAHFENNLKDGGKVYLADVPKVRFFLEGKLTGPIEVRYRLKDNAYTWLSISGRIYYDDNENPVKLIGKINDISLEKQQEQSLLIKTERDKVTNFNTWNVGLKMLDQETDSGNSEYRSTIVYIHITNLDVISHDLGVVIGDAVISRIAAAIRSLTKDGDVRIRVAYSSFVLLVKEMSIGGREEFEARFKKRLKSIYKGIGQKFELNYVIHFCTTLVGLFDIMPAEEKFSGNDAISRSNGISGSDEITTFAFNLLERAADFNSAIQLVLERICVELSIDSIHIISRDTTTSQEVINCIYEVELRPREGFGSILGKKFQLEHSDAEATVGALGENDCAVLTPELYDSFSPGLQRCTTRDANMLYSSIRAENAVWGFIIYERYDTTNKWTRDDKDKLNEITSIIGSYILRDVANRASAAKSNFLSSMSHEIRTPMNAIKGFSELILSDKNISEKTKKYASDIRQASNNLISIVNEILDFSKIESGKFEIIEDKYSMSSLLYDVTALIGMRLIDTPIEFIVNIDPNLPEEMYGDATRIRQIFVNILGNSVKYTERGEIELKVSWDAPMMGAEDKGNLFVTVRDTGIGIRKEDIDKLFDSFTQVDTKRNKGITGTGLGLAVCKNLLMLMDGQINVSSEYGKGSVFSFYLPQTALSAEKCSFIYGQSGKEHDDGLEISFIAPNAHALVVDDNKVNLEVARGLIEKYGIKVNTATSGREAIDFIKENSGLDIIFMDHMMPMMDGIETTKIIRELPEEWTKKIPIVALTANAIKGVENLFFNVGMNAFLSKPIEIKKLESILEEFLPKDKQEEVPPDYGLEKEENSEEKDKKILLKAILRGIDFESGIGNCQGDVKSYLGLLDAFVGQNQFGTSDAQLEERDIKNYRITVHALKSSARYIGAMELSDMAKHLEDLAKDEKVDEILVDHPKLKKLYEPVFESAKEALERCIEKKPSHTGGADADTQKLIDALETIAKQLDNFDYDAAADTVNEVLDSL